jgi:hypothetical protein
MPDIMLDSYNLNLREYLSDFKFQIFLARIKRFSIRLLISYIQILLKKLMPFESPLSVAALR